MIRLLAPFSFFVATHSVLAYGILFLAVFWEGEIVTIAAAVLVHLYVLWFVPTIVVIVFAAIAKTLIGYRLGQYIGKKFPDSRALKYLEKRVLYFLPRFRERPFISIFISKVIYGVNNVALVFAGYVGANFKKYLLAEFVSSFFWLGIMFGLGYFFSTQALSMSHNLRHFTLIIVLYVIGFFVLLKTVNLIIEIIEEWSTQGKK